MSLAESQGAKAVANGLVVEEHIRSMLRLIGYSPIKASTLEELKSKRHGLFPETGCFAQHCLVPLAAEYHAGKNRFAKVDFVVFTPVGEYVLISTKSQRSNGSAEQKLEYEIQQLIATELPAAMLIYGPIAGRDAKEGFTAHVLEEIWERTKHYASNRIFLFRTLDKLSRWMQDGLPVSGRGITRSSVFAQYCDREP